MSDVQHGMTLMFFGMVCMGAAALLIAVALAAFISLLIGDQDA